MFVCRNFSYNGIDGSDMYGLMLVRTDNGMIEQKLGIARKTVTETVKNKSKVYSYGFEDSVMTFTAEFAKEDAWTFAERVAVSKWLFEDTYCDFVSEDFDLVYKCVAVGDPYFYTNGLNGYLKVEFECDAPFAYSPSSTSAFDLSSNPSGGTIINVYNNSNVPNYYFYNPEIEFTLVGANTSFKSTNLSDSNRVFQFTSLTALETVYVNNETQKIYSALSDTRLNNLTDKRFLRLKYGLNRLKIEGTCTVNLRYQFPMIL